MRTPLGPSDTDPRLCDLDPTKRLDEMRFDLPVRSTDAAVRLADIADVFDQHLVADDPMRRYADRLRSFAPRRFRGYLTGAIDLTVQMPPDAEPRFVVIDYKSNALPALGEEPSPADYGPSPLGSVMLTSNYVLQSHAVSGGAPPLPPMAASRATTRSVHLGGSMYLFVRGMVGADTPVIDGERCGVARLASAGLVRRRRQRPVEGRRPS